MSRNMDDYVEVSERIDAFYEKYPDGSLQGHHRFQTVGDKTIIIYEAQAYRHADDPRPANGTASEPFPGETNFTRGSEVMNAETSAWGRAIAALGFEVKRGIASANEVRNRRGEDEPAAKPKSNGRGELATTAQKTAITKDCKRLGIEDEHKPALLIWAGGDPLTKGKAGKLITLLKTAKSFDEVWTEAKLPNPRKVKPSENGETLEDVVTDPDRAEQLGVEVAD